MGPPALVEAATNGVTFKMQPQITGVMLIPSKIIRPWTVIMEHEGLGIFAYSVSDEHLMADADAPPSYLVDLFKALGDERRLRILGILSEGEAALMDIAERLDLAKSTAHHHLRILRTAGLVRVTVGDSKGYSLRRDQIPETARLLDAYLTTPKKPPRSPDGPRTKELTCKDKARSTSPGPSPASICATATTVCTTPCAGQGHTQSATGSVAISSNWVKHSPQSQQNHS